MTTERERGERESIAQSELILEDERKTKMTAIQSANPNRINDSLSLQLVQGSRQFLPKFDLSISGSPESRNAIDSGPEHQFFTVVPAFSHPHLRPHSSRSALSAPVSSMTVSWLSPPSCSRSSWRSTRIRT